MRQKASIAQWAVLGVLALTAWGCAGGMGGKPPMAKVTGKVTYKGAPVTQGTITFFPIEDKGAKNQLPAVGELSSNGSFELTTFDTGDGAVLGQHKAVLKVSSFPAGTLPGNSPDDIRKMESDKSVIPPQYTNPEKTPLKYTVVEGKNDFAIELKD